MSTWRSMRRVYGGLVVLAGVCLWLNVSEAEEVQKGKDGQKGKVIQIDLSKLPPDLAKRLERGLVFVNVDLHGDAPSLLEALGSFVDACADFPIEQFVPAIERTHVLECNWKTYADNYLEGYHVPLVHPGLNKEIDAKRYQVDVDERDRWVEQHAPALGDPELIILADLPLEAVERPRCGAGCAGAALVELAPVAGAGDRTLRCGI